MTGREQLLQPTFVAALRPHAPAAGRVARVLALAVTYALAARFGTALALDGGGVVPLWSPAGVAVGVLLIWGRGLWPGIALGAVMGNLGAGMTTPSAITAGAGSTVEALVAVELLARSGFDARLDRLRAVLIFAIAGCAVPAVVGASFGVAAAAFGGTIGTEAPLVIWLGAWAGDSIRILAVAGLMVAWLAPQAIPLAGRRSEAVVGVACAASLSAVLFFDVLDLQASGQSVAFPIIPVLIWIAFRVGPRGTTLAATIVSVIALVATERGLGPFVGTTGHGSLMYVAVFLGLVILTGDAVAAVVAEREAGRKSIVEASRNAEKSLRELGALESIGRMLAESGPTPEALDSVMASLVEVFGYRYPSIYTGDPEHLQLGAQRGYDDPILAYDGSCGVIGRVMRTGEIAFVGDVLDDPEYISKGDGVVSEIAVPLRAHGEFLGVLNVESPSRLDERDLSCVTVVADRVAAAIALARERFGLAARAEIFRRLATFTRRVTGVLAQDELYRETVDALDGVVPADLVVLTVLDTHSREYVVRAEKGSPGAVGNVIRPGEGPAGLAIRDRIAIMLDHYPRSAYPESLKGTNTAPEYANAVGMPLLGEDGVLGALTIARIDEGRPFTDLELEAYELLARAITLAISNAFLHGEVSERAVRDGLTGLHNRRYFDSAFAQLIAGRQRNAGADQAPLSAIMFDLDHFGDFNKLHGHQVGDEVLRVFGRILARRLREGDLLARYGGEEFIAVVPGATTADARRIAEDIRATLAATVVHGVSGEALTVTVSAGCASADPADPSGEALIRATDVGLIMAKRAGRNRVVSA